LKDFNQKDVLCATKMEWLLSLKTGDEVLLRYPSLSYPGSIDLVVAIETNALCESGVKVRTASHPGWLDSFWIQQFNKDEGDTYYEN
jgi:hypothetical protein